MIGQINQKGYTLIPLKVYFSGSFGESSDRIMQR